MVAETENRIEHQREDNLSDNEDVRANAVACVDGVFVEAAALQAKIDELKRQMVVHRRRSLSRKVVLCRPGPNPLRPS